MHRLARLAFSLLVVGAVASGGCARKKPVVRDQLEVEQLRLRITKVRNAVSETRAVIASSRGAPYLPEIYMRLAELLSEEARYHYMVAYEREQRKTKSLHVPQVRFLKEQAISTYRFILKKYPKTRLADRVLFNISHEQRELGEFEEMRKTLVKLVDDYPDSNYRTEALLVLGDFHFDKSEFAKAERYFSQIIEIGGPLMGLAHYKMGWVEVNKASCKRALERFESAIKVTRRSEKKKVKKRKKAKKRKTAKEFEIPKPETDGIDYAGHKSLDVQREALVDLTYCYAQERKPEKAVSYLQKLAVTREAYVAALAKLANRYALIEQPRGAAEVARELLRLAPDAEDRLDDARMLHTALTRMKDYSEVGDDVELLLRTMRRQALRPNLKPDARKRLVKEFELIARDLATKSHEILMNKGKRLRGTAWSKHPVTAKETAEAYENYLNVVPHSESHLEVVMNLADVLYESKQYLKAGHRFRESAALLLKPPPVPKAEEGKKDGKDKKDTKGQLNDAVKAAAKDKKAVAKAATPKKKKKVKGKKRSKGKKAKEEDKPMTAEERQKERLDALYNAVAAYQKTLDAESERNFVVRTEARAGLREAGGFYLAEGALEEDKSKKIKFAIAQSFYDEGNYLEAVDLLLAIAYEYPGTKQGDASVHMVLDSYNTLNDMNALISGGRRLLGDSSPVVAGVKSQIKPIIASAEQRRLDELSLAASGDQVGGMEMLLAFAERYKGTDLGERAMLSAFVAARAGGDTKQVYELGEAVVERFPDSNQASGVIGTMGRTAAARFDFEQSIEYLERAASMSEDQRVQLLLAAGELREQLADRLGALKNYRQALKVAGSGPQRAEAAMHIAVMVEKGGSPALVVKELTPLKEPYDAEVASRLGLALVRVGEYDEAEMILRSVTDGASEASAEASARAYYGVAEIMFNILETYEPPPEMYAIEELISVIEVVLQSFLAAARQPDPTFSLAALGRLARAAELGAEKLNRLKLPVDLTAEEQGLVKDALAQRADQLLADSQAVLADCAERAKASYHFDEGGRACLEGRAPKSDPIKFYDLAERPKVSAPKHMEEVRERLARNPEDLPSLRELGRAYLKVNDAHAARIVLGRAVEAGGDMHDINALGVASYIAGDQMGALDAFGRAKDAGSGAASLNLITVYEQMGLDELADEERGRVPEETEGLLIKGAGSTGGGAR